jgi:hypothetical protein
MPLSLDGCGLTKKWRIQFEGPTIARRAKLGSQFNKKEKHAKSVRVLFKASDNSWPLRDFYFSIQRRASPAGLLHEGEV